ncbi:MAG: tryptophan 7-halogenase [Sphingomonadales bacterium]|nr:tryptophan 7-halogenase [Sphingomonadales bacterium]
MSGTLRHVVIVGRDADLWLTATALREALGPAGVAVTAVELPTWLGSASAYATLPAIESLHARLGIDEAALLRTTGGSFSLGYNIVPPAGAPFFVAHGAYGAPIDGGDFFPLWLKARRFGLAAQFEDFSPTAMAARHGRVLLPDEDTELFGRTDYAYHLPAVAYAAMLKGRAQRLGVAIHQAVRIGVERDGGSGVIQAVTPDGGPPVAGDLFIDASGPEAVLIGGALGIAIEDWRDVFPYDRRLTARGKPFATIPTYADLRLSQASWTALYAAQAATHVVHAFRAGDGDEAAVAAAASASGLTLSDIAISPVAPGLRAKAWSGNCVAIGASACALDPLFDLDLHLVQLGIVHLLSLFPNAAGADSERGEYNRITRSLFERLRDFQAVPYVLAGASRTAPDGLRHKMDTFRARGAIAPMEDETFSPDQWRALFVGLGLMPETWPPSIEAVRPERMKEGFRRILGFVRTKVLEQPTHENYLADIGADRAA